MASGLAPRWSASGTVAVQVPPSQAWVQSLPSTAPLRITSAVSGKKPSVLPCVAAGRPSTRTFSVLPSTAMAPGVFSAVGWAAKAASKAALCIAVEPCAGRVSANSPSSGMHSLRHTSQLALSFSGTPSAPVSETGGRKSGATVSGTGSSTVFS